MIPYIILGAIITIWILIMTYLMVGTYLNKKATRLFEKSMDFYIRSSLLFKCGDNESAHELREVAEVYSEEADWVYNKAKRWRKGQLRRRSETDTIGTPTGS